MRFGNKLTGDTVELPPPDRLGASTVIFNGKVVESCLYSDEDGGSVTLGDGRRFTEEKWTYFILQQLKTGAWNQRAEREGI